MAGGKRLVVRHGRKTAKGVRAANGVSSYKMAQTGWKGEAFDRVLARPTKTLKLVAVALKGPFFIPGEPAFQAGEFGEVFRALCLNR